MCGYWNKILNVDLTEQSVEIKDVNENVWKKVLGGAGYGAYVLYNEVPAEVDAFNPENRIVFATGPFQASRISGVGKWTVTSKSPANNYQAHSSVGGDFGINLKRDGFDALVVKGKSEKPSYLYIEEVKCEVRDASELWGLDTYEVTDELKEMHDDVGVVTIGQGGENFVRYAAIVSDKHSFAGRCGLGAVMGSKNLKAIVVKNGEKEPPVARPDELKEMQRELNKNLAQEKASLRKHGTPMAMEIWEETGDIPVKNWIRGSWKEGNEKLGAPNYTEKILVGKYNCKYCLVGCHRHVKVDEPEKYKVDGQGPHYETLCMIGENCLIDDLEAVAKANDMCARYGLDSISVGGVIAYMMEAKEKGYFEDVDIGEEITWGNGDAAIKLIELIGKREGIGDILAEGVAKAAEELDPETKDFAFHVKGLEVPAHDPRAHFAVGLNYITGARGPGHEKGNLQIPYHGILIPEAGIINVPDRFDMNNIEYLTIKYQDWSALYDSQVMCRFMIGANINFGSKIDILNAITGWDMDHYDILKMGERIFTLQRLVNLKYGMTKEEEKLQDRFYETTDEGGHKGEAPENLNPYLKRYYELRGWDENGVPTEKKLRRLDLDEIIEF